MVTLGCALMLCLGGCCCASPNGDAGCLASVLVLSSCARGPRATGNGWGEQRGAVPGLFGAAAQASRRALGGFLSAGEGLQDRVISDGFVRPGTAAGLGGTST